jgi:hypothetical protein
MTIVAVVSPPDPTAEGPSAEARVGGGEVSVDTTVLFPPYLALGGFVFVALANAAPLVGIAPLPGLRRCPDCAKRVPAAANVCRFCGYRFDHRARPDPWLGVAPLRQ